jgi:hypothetical protein
MSQTITVQICDQAYDAIRTQAPSSGVSEMQVAADVRERQFRNCAVLTEEQKRVANERFERHFGEIAVGSGADNESIDADLAREYASDHEGN